MEVEPEAIISGCLLASLKGSSLNIHRCLEHVTWRGDWDQIRRGTDGNETEMGSQNKHRKEGKNKCNVNGKTLMGFYRRSYSYRSQFLKNKCFLTPDVYFMIR